MIGLPILNCEGFGPARSEEALFLGLSVYDNSPSRGCQLLTIALLTIGIDNLDQDGLVTAVVHIRGLLFCIFWLLLMGCGLFYFYEGGRRYCFPEQVQYKSFTLHYHR